MYTTQGRWYCCTRLLETLLDLCPNLTHAVCNAHILRGLTWVEAHYPMLTWAPAFKTLLLAMKKAKEKAVSKEKSTLSGYLYRKFNKEYKASVCLFIRDFRVPFDNNEAERSVRMTKAKSKIIGCFRSEEGAQDYLNIMSVVSTANKHGVSGYKAITSIICGNTDAIFQVH